MVIDDQPATGRLVGGEHRFPLRVYFEDTDLTGIVYHANYLRYFERARSDMLRVAGIDQRAAFDAGEGAYAVTEMSIRYRRPARLDDALIVASHLSALRPAVCVIQQSVIRDGQELVDASVTVAFVGANGRAKRQPAAWLERMHGLMGKGAE